MTYLQSKVGAVTQMDSLKYTGCDGSTRANLLRFGKCKYTAVGDSCTFNQTYALKFW